MSSVREGEQEKKIKDMKISVKKFWRANDNEYQYRKSGRAGYVKMLYILIDEVNLDERKILYVVEY